MNSSLMKLKARGLAVSVLVLSALVVLPATVQAALKPLDPSKIAATGAEATLLSQAIGTAAVSGLDCAEGIDFAAGKVNCSAFSDDGADISVDARLAPVIAEAKKIFEKVNHLSPGVNVIVIASAQCDSAETCVLTLNSGGGAL